MQGAREPGFYWVRLKNEEEWRIGEYVSGVWSVPFRPGLFEDDEFAEVDPERIVRGVTRLYPRM
jgi:hypothetical protein